MLVDIYAIHLVNHSPDMRVRLRSPIPRCFKTANRKRKHIWYNRSIPKSYHYRTMWESYLPQYMNDIREI